MKWVTLPVAVAAFASLGLGLLIGGYIAIQPAQWEKAWVENLRSFGPAISAIASFFAASVAIGIALFSERGSNRRFFKSLRKDYRLDMRANERQQAEWNRQNELNWARSASEHLTVLKDVHGFISQAVSQLRLILRTDEYDISTVRKDADKVYRLDKQKIMEFEDKITSFDRTMSVPNHQLFNNLENGWNIPIFTDITNSYGEPISYYDRVSVLKLIKKYEDFLYRNAEQRSEINNRLSNLDQHSTKKDAII